MFSIYLFDCIDLLTEAPHTCWARTVSLCSARRCWTLAGRGAARNGRPQSQSGPPWKGRCWSPTSFAPPNSCRESASDFGESTARDRSAGFNSACVQVHTQQRSCAAPSASCCRRSGWQSSDPAAHRNWDQDSDNYQLCKQFVFSVGKITV